MGRDVTICEMAPRDGLQVVNRSATIPLADRAALIASLQSAGLPYIEAGAFVSARRIPAMADSAALLEKCRPYEGQMAALVPNLKYYERFREANNLDTVALFVSASEAYSLKNTRMTVDEALSAAEAVATEAHADGFRLRVHVSGAFRDLTDDNAPMKAGDVERVCAQLREIAPGGVIALADTDGRAEFGDVERILSHLESTIGLDDIGVHLHDRGGQGLPKVKLAYGIGVRVFDGAVGGVGGNPSAIDDPVGNVATEEIVQLFEKSGIRTGIDMERLIEAGKMMARMTASVGDPPPPSRLLRQLMGG